MLKSHPMIRAFRSSIELPFEWRVQRYEVADGKGKYIAPVLDVLCAEQDKKVRYIVIEIGGALGISGKKVLMVPELLTRVGNGMLYSSEEEEVLLGAPSAADPFNPTRKEEEAIYDYFGLKPYWAQALEEPENKEEGKKDEPE